MSERSTLGLRLVYWREGEFDGDDLGGFVAVFFVPVGLCDKA